MIKRIGDAFNCATTSRATLGSISPSAISMADRLLSDSVVVAATKGGEFEKDRAGDSMIGDLQLVGEERRRERSVEADQCHCAESGDGRCDELGANFRGNRDPWPK